MAQVEVNKNLDNIQEKSLFGLTKRQLVCFSFGGISGIAVYFITMKIFPTDLTMILAMIISLPFFVAGMYKHDGLYIEDYIKVYIEYRFKRPRIRTYQVNNIYGYLKDKIYQEEVLGLDFKEFDGENNRRTNGTRVQKKNRDQKKTTQKRC